MVTSISLIKYRNTNHLINEKKEGYYYANICDKSGGYACGPGLRYLQIYEPYKFLETEGDIISTKV